MTDAPVLSTRALNRALLARQHLLDRAPIGADPVIEHLVGMQAQVPRDPYVALWSRVRDFQPPDLETLLLERGAVRVPTLRTTIHLHTAADALRIAPTLAPVRERTLKHTPFGKATAHVDRRELLEVARAAYADGRPLVAADLGARLHERWPEVDGQSLAYTVHYLLAIVQPPPRGLWTETARPAWTPLEQWLGPPPSDPITPDELVLRYLAAIGPATVADARTWSWLTGLREAFDRLRPQLVTFRDERRRELFDLPDAARPPEDTPAPPRFLPEYDNLGLSHDDRTRDIPPQVVPRLTGWVGSFLVDGFVHGQWRLDRDPERARLVLDPFLPLEGSARDELVGEAERLLAWAARDSRSRAVEFGVARQPAARRRAADD